MKSYEEIQIMQLTREKEELERQLAEEKEASSRHTYALNKDIAFLNATIREQKRELSVLRSKLTAVKAFIARLGKKPVIGKQIVKEFDAVINSPDTSDPDDQEQ